MSPSPSPSPTVRHDLTDQVRLIEHLLIPLSDGTRLAARMWLPADPEALPVPAVLEAIPYRKGDVTAVDDAVRFGYVAAHGYACLRVDLRGSGDSEGVLPDEYDPQEQADLVEVIAWIAAQDWCTGAVGMTGISWSGFNSLQVAAHAPPALKAVITVCSTDDRYDNDVHYLGGTVLAFYLVVWAHVMLGFNARPPDPATVGPAWREMWLERLQGDTFLAERWLRHQLRDDYWRQGSVIEDYARIQVPVLAVGGWADAYTDAVLRLADGLPGVCRAIIGPWGHTWPERGFPGPAIGFLQENVRWWDQWLKGLDTGVLDDPLLRYWLQEPVVPRPDLPERPGRWLATGTVPQVSRHAVPLWLDTTGLIRHPPHTEAKMPHRSDLSLGADAGSWLPYGNPTDLPPDQATEDAGSLVFDSAPLTAPFDVVGMPLLELDVAADQPVATVTVRLCSVSPDGVSSLLTRGALNLTHRLTDQAGLNRHDVAELLRPGVNYRVGIRLKGIAQTVPAGHRIRVAISTSYWPWLWPAPHEATITVSTGLGANQGARILLPQADPADADRPAPIFDPPEIAAAPPVEQLRERVPHVRAEYDEQTGEHRFFLRRDLTGRQRFASGLVYADDEDCVFRIQDGDPLSARVELARTTEISGPGWYTSVTVRSSMSCTADTFVVQSRLTAHEGDELVFAQDYGDTFPRDHA
jgi:putative CocE/NonD family hydrolase